MHDGLLVRPSDMTAPLMAKFMCHHIGKVAPIQGLI